MQPVIIDVDSPDDILAGYGALAKIRVERDTSSAMSTAAEITTITVVAGTPHYEYWDTTGTSAHYYRTRFSTASPSVASDYSDYSDVLRSGQVTTYGSVADLIELLPQTTGTRNENVLQDCLVRATNLINAKCGRDFFRHPQVSGTETWYARTSGGDRLWVIGGIASLTLVEYASSFGGTFTALGAENTDWYLDDQAVANGEALDSYFSLRLPSSGSLGQWPTGPRLARLTGVRGWGTVPTIIESGSLSLARAFAVKSLGGAGSPVGDYDIPTAMLPTETYIAIEWGSHLLRHSRV